MNKKGYRHCHYNGRERLIYLRTWDDEGNRIVRKHIHKPYLFVRSDKITGYESIFGDNLKKMEFDTSGERNNFVNTTNVEIFYNMPVEQQFLLDHYKDTNFEDLLDAPLKVVSIDIECPAGEFDPNHRVQIRSIRNHTEVKYVTVEQLPDYQQYEVYDAESARWSSIHNSIYLTRKGGFPDPTKAEHPVNVIGCHDSLTGKYHIFGIGHYNTYAVKDHCRGIEPEDVVYYNCVDERTLFKKFLRWWRSDFPDVIVSWNGFSFDVPYIVNRINRLFGEDKARHLSPYDDISFKEVRNEKYGNTYREYTFKGITHLDYMVLYKTLKPEKNLDSFNLDSVAQEELSDVAKLDLEGMGLFEFSKRNFEKYVSYNIQDIHIINLLDQKLKLIELTRFLCTMGFTNFERVYGKISFIAGMFARRSLEKGKYMLTRRPEKNPEQIPGGHVKEPSIGLREDVVYFDANSLYPNTIITLNISPETKRGKAVLRNQKYEVTLGAIQKTVEPSELKDFLVAQNLTMTGSGDLFTKNFMGVLPEFCDYLYRKRVEHKELMLGFEAEATRHPKTSDDYKRAKNSEGTQYIIQNVYKTVMNSCYGVLLNPYFPLYDRDCGMSITLSGQKIIQETFTILNRHMKSLVGIDKDYVVCGDTDSVAVELKEYLTLIGANIYGPDGFLNETFKPIEDELSNVLNNTICEWVALKMNASDIRYRFKRETVCRNALFIAKKNYILNIVNKEGVNVKKLVVKGHLNKAVCSKRIKTIGNDLAKGIIIGGWDESKSITFYQDIVINELYSMTVGELAIRKNIKDYDKYANQSHGLKTAPKTPNQHKAAIAYNYMLRVKNLEEVYPRVVNGTKVQIVQVKPNEYGITELAYIDKFPEEFGLELDFKATAQKSLIYYIKPLFECLGWSTPDIHNLYSFNLNELF